MLQLPGRYRQKERRYFCLEYSPGGKDAACLALCGEEGGVMGFFILVGGLVVGLVLDLVDAVPAWHRDAAMRALE